MLKSFSEYFKIYLNVLNRKNSPQQEDKLQQNKKL